MPANKEQIVVGVDGSPGSQAALEWAARYGRKIGGEVCAVAVWRIAPPFGDKLATPEETFRSQARAELDAALNELKRSEPECRVEDSLERGEPAQVLLRHARDADMVVLGDKGRGPVKGFLMGSVVTEFLRHAPCPVVLVRPDNTT